MQSYVDFEQIPRKCAKSSSTCVDKSLYFGHIEETGKNVVQRPEQMIRMAGILLDIADGTHRDFDELILEKRGTTYWIHFAVRPKDNRRKILFDCR